MQKRTLTRLSKNSTAKDSHGEFGSAVSRFFRLRGWETHRLVASWRRSCSKSQRSMTQRWLNEYLKWIQRCNRWWIWVSMILKILLATNQRWKRSMARLLNSWTGGRIGMAIWILQGGMDEYGHLHVDAPAKEYCKIADFRSTNT